MKASRELLATRNHARKMCEGNVATDEEKVLWNQIANEIDRFMNYEPEPSLF